MARFWFDTEFMEDGARIELLSIGIVCDDGRELYQENGDADWSHANLWVVENVLPHLVQRPYDHTSRSIVATHEGVGIRIREFVNAGEGQPEFWAYYGAYDWIALCQLFGRMVDLPEGWPMFVMDVKQQCISKGNPILPKQDDTQHHALNNARWTRVAWACLEAQPHARWEPKSSCKVTL